jgi:hypothetical protein
MYQYFSQAKRGGITNFGEINLANVNKNSQKCIKCLDMNGLYPNAMCLPLPYKDSSFMSPDEATQTLTANCKNVVRFEL